MGISATLAAGVVAFYQDLDQDPCKADKAGKAGKAAACSALYDGPAFKVPPL
jgi:hypothetical protein